MAPQSRSRWKFKSRKLVTRKSILRCHGCSHVARDHFKLKRHIVVYHRRLRLQKRPNRRKFAMVRPSLRNKTSKSGIGKGGVCASTRKPNSCGRQKRSKKTEPENNIKEKSRKAKSSVLQVGKKKNPRNAKAKSNASNKSNELAANNGRPVRSSRKTSRSSRKPLSQDKKKSAKEAQQQPPKKKRSKSDREPLKCTLCDYVCRDSFNLKRHTQSKHVPKRPKSPKNYQCELCPYNSKHRFLLKRHTAVHLRDRSRRSPSGMATGSHPCDKCSYVSSSSCNLRRHQVSRHEKPREAKLQCSLCDHRDADRKALFHHFHESHGVIIETERLEFRDLNAFSEWKTETEKVTFARFVRQQTRTRQKKYVILKCHRDGVFKSKSRGERKRELKTTGSNKINSACPASMKLAIELNGVVSVLFTKTHVGHSNEVCRLTLTKDEKTFIGEMLAAKWTFQEILGEIRNGVGSERLGRIHFLTRKDLQNIERWYKTRDVDDPPKMTINVDVGSWIAKVKGSDAVRFYKRPKTILPKPFKSLEYEDFVLILANPIQLAMLKQFGSDCICIDNSYDNSQMKLTTLMILDDSRLAFPCAFMLSNKLDKIVMKHFIDIIKKESGCPLTPSVLIADIPETRRSEWSSVMELPKFSKNFYSSWSVDEDLKRNLKKVKEEPDRIEVRKIIDTLMSERDVNQIPSLMECSVEFFEKNAKTEAFGKVFKSKYSCVADKWVLCLKEKLMSSSSSENLKSLHETLKYLYSEGIKSAKLEDCVGMLMRCVRDQVQDRIFITIEDETRSLVETISRSHDDAHDMKSQPDDTGVYEIVQNNVTCRCGLRCYKCDVCIHSYRCTCADSTLGWTICRHIHYCAMNSEREEPTSLSSHPFDPAEEKRKLLLEFENMCDDIAAGEDILGDAAAIEVPVIELALQEEELEQQQNEFEREQNELEQQHQQGWQQNQELEQHLELKQQQNELEQQQVGIEQHQQESEKQQEQLEQQQQELEQQQQNELQPSPFPPQQSLEVARLKLLERFQNICRNLTSDVDVACVDVALVALENASASR